MGDAENFQPSKKRAAGVQISRENPGLDDEEETPEGTFKKASEDVLATRRIVKVRRQKPATTAAPPSSASNPFAAIRLVTPTSSSPSVIESSNGESKEAEQFDKSKSENNIDKPSEDVSTTKEERTAENKVDHSEAQPKDENDIVVNEDKKESVAADVAESRKSRDGATKSAEPDTSETQTGKGVKEETDIVVNKDKEKSGVAEVAESGKSGDGTTKSTEADTCENKKRKGLKDENDVVNEDGEKSVAAEVAASGNSGDGETKSTEADTSKIQTGKGVKDDGDEKDKQNEETAEKKDEAVPFGSFQILSSSQNAFSGLTGTGFSTTSFSFGSLTKDGTGPKSDSSTFSFGLSNNGNSSIFGNCEPVSTGKIENSKFPPMQEVPLETGEENESVVFTADSILFEYIDGAWKERGKGEVKINVPTTGTGKARLVMRARGNYRLILNASLFPDMKLTKMDKKGITFACVNSASEAKDGLSTIALKFKDPSIVEHFHTAVTNHISAAPAALKTPEISPKTDD